MKPPKISELLEKINHTADNADFSAISKIEFDLLMQHIRDLYAELDSLKNAATTVKQSPATVIKRTINPNQNVLINEPEQKEVVQKEIVTKPVISEPAQTVLPVKESAISQTVINTNEQPVAKAEVKHKETATKTTINESVQSFASINEKLKAPATEVHRKLSTKPLKDLIDLNKKFILLNELFKGNAEAYSAAIHYIDTSEDYASAEAFIKTELASNYFWDETSQSVRMFMKLVKQKYGWE